MKPFPDDSLSPEPGSCEAFQWEASQCLDENRPLSVTLSAHLQTCRECAEFHADWNLDGAFVAALVKAPTGSPEVSARLVRTVIAEPQTAVAPVRKNLRPIDFLLRAAAVLLLGALSWWLLDSRSVPPRSHPADAGAALPAWTLERQAARLEAPLRREREALKSETVSGLAEVRTALDFSILALQP